MACYTRKDNCNKTYDHRIIFYEFILNIPLACCPLSPCPCMKRIPGPLAQPRSPETRTHSACSYQGGPANQETVYIWRTNRPGQSGESLHEEDKQAGQSGDRLHVEDKQARPIRHNITYRLPLYSINLAILKQIPFLKGFFFSFLIFDKFRLNKMTSSYRNLLRTCLKVKQNYI